MSLFKKFLSFFFICFFSLFLTVLSVKVKAETETETIVFGNQGYSNQQAISSYEGTNFEITFDKGSNNSNAPKYYTTGKAIRAYAGNTFTISSIDNINKILNINIEFASGEGSNAITVSSGTYNTGIWTGNAPSITFTVGGSSGHRRIASITVKCETRLSINFDANGGTGSNPTTIKVTKGCDSSELPAPSYIYSKHNFVGWNTKTDGLGTPYSVGDTIKKVQEDITLYAQWEEVSEIESLQSALDNIVSRISASYKLNYFSNVDLLNFNFIGIAGTTYTDWSDKKSNSDAIYAGQSAGSYSSIQLRSDNNNSGIVTSSSGGKVKKITVVWNSNTASGRTIDIYGKNSAYLAATELYDTNTQGTKLGSIVYGTSTELVINDDYEYIGIRSTNGAIYLDQIRIEWNDGPLYEVAEDSDFRLKLGADLDLSNVINQLDEEHRTDADYGIELSYKETTKFISFKSSQTGLYEDNVNNIKYILISLGTMFDNTKADATTEFTVKPCVKYDGNTYYSNHAEGSKTYSYASMIEAYYANNATKEAVEPLYYIMQQKGLIA